MFEKINGSKSNIGFAAAAALKLIVDFDKEDSITWESKWVVILGSAILFWTGVAIRHAIKKSGK